MPMPVARLTSMHVCPAFTGPVPHVGGIIAMGMPTVLAGMLPVSRMGDPTICVGPPGTVIMGSPTVLVGSMPAARMGDPCAHGGVIVFGLPTVIVGP